MAGSWIVLLVLLASWLNCSAAGPLSGHRVVRVRANSEESTKALVGFLYNSTNIDVWKFPTKFDNSADIRLTPNDFKDTVRMLRSDGYDVTTLIGDVQELMDSQKVEGHRLKYVSEGFEYSTYHTLNEIFDWMDNKTQFYKDRCSIVEVATSYENRPLRALKISTPSSTVARPALWIQGGIHAREWISPATVIYIAGKMLDYYKLDQELTKTVDEFDWYFLPVTNPDGYTYTWKGDQERLWRKTRSPQSEDCIGVDPNRNWDIAWCEEGASKNPCSDTFCGPSVFSEQETKGVSDFIMDKVPNAKGFIDVHSYSQLWMSPRGYTFEKPPDFEQQDEGSTLAVKALEKMYGTRYEHGTIASTIYVTSGSSTDWAYEKAKIKYSYAVELRDTGRYGFLLPADQIIPTGEETLEGLRALADYISRN